MRAHRDPAALAAAVADTVYHEIAHHFGISDRRLQEFKALGR
jgi:predicted Zn-dependent protease with MMP-like domain